MRPPQHDRHHQWLPGLAGHVAAERRGDAQRIQPADRGRETYTAGAKSLKWAALFVGESSRLLYGLSGVRNEVPLGNWMGSGVDSVKIGAATFPASDVCRLTWSPLSAFSGR